MSHSDAQAGQAARRSWTRDWRVRAGAALVLAILLAWLVQVLATGASFARLLRAEPDLSAQDPQMARFAASVARPLYARHCASCHGADMKGDRARGVPNLVDKDWLYGEGHVPEIEKTILYGVRSGHPRSWNLADMPAFGEETPYKRYKVPPLKPQQIHDLVEYIRLISGKDADRASASQGQAVFADTGQCFDCHANDAVGDSAIGAPNLVDDIWLYGDGSRASVFRSIAHGHQGACPAWTKRMKPGEIRAMAVYIHNLAAKAPAQPAHSQGKPS